jgi:hypothetical protein
MVSNARERSAWAVLLAMLALPATGGAAVVFENTGTTSGWSTLWHEDQGSVTQVMSPAYKGGRALGCRTIHRVAYRGRYHSVARRAGMAKRGQDRYYGFAFYLPSNWQFVAQNFNIQQFIGNVSGCSGGQPITMTGLLNRELITRIVTGPDGCTRTSHNISVVPSVSPGAWHRVVIRGRWQSNNTGSFQVWYDGSRKINRTNTPTCPAADTAFNLAVGNYSNGWHDDKKMVGTQATRDVFIDHVRVATSYNEAEPRCGSSAAYRQRRSRGTVTVVVRRLELPNRSRLATVIV